MVYKVYCDESRQVGSYEYRLVGGIWAPPEDGWSLVNDFRARCRALGRRDPLGELSFKYAPSRPTNPLMRYYEVLIDSFFAHSATVYFRTVIVPKEYRFSDPYYHGGDYETGF